MPLLNNQLYHCYNQGNNKEKIFISDEDYLIFLRLIRLYIFPQCDILAWCLMPNHFHFLFHTTLQSVAEVKLGNILSQNLTNALRLVLSKYAQVFNENYSRTGSLFRQKTKFKDISDGEQGYDITILNYIHQNPVTSLLVSDACEWPYSSAREFAGTRKGTLTNVKLARQILQL